jgi:protocatechuate 3,4-dioxygenase beta subunit
LSLALQVVEAGNCAPRGGVRVDVWHADALGAYSDYGRGGTEPAASKTFLRGTVIADRDGRTTFTTIYPGWYPGRTPHIHFKVFLDRRNTLTGQMYFPDDVSDAVYAGEAPYNVRGGARSATNANDGVLRSTRNARAAFCTVERTAGAYAAGLVIGIDRGRSST